LPWWKKLTTDPYKKKWIKYALILAYFTIFYNIAEGAVSIAYGAEDSSVSLAGFGFDSIIEVISAFFVLYRLARETGHPNSFTLLRERVGTIAIGILFIFLGATTLLGSVVQLVNGHHPKTTLSGIIISLIALGFCPFYGGLKEKHQRF